MNERLCTANVSCHKWASISVRRAIYMRVGISRSIAPACHLSDMHERLCRANVSYHICETTHSYACRDVAEHRSWMSHVTHVCRDVAEHMCVEMSQSIAPACHLSHMNERLCTANVSCHIWTSVSVRRAIHTCVRMSWSIAPQRHSFRCDTRLSHVTWLLHTWRNSFICMWNDSFTCVSGCCRATDGSFMWGGYDSVAPRHPDTHVNESFHICDMRHSLCRDAHLYVTGGMQEQCSATSRTHMLCDIPTRMWMSRDVAGPLITEAIIAYMGCLRLVGSLKLWVSFAKEPYKRDYILQKRSIFMRSLLLMATPHMRHVTWVSQECRCIVQRHVHNAECHRSVCASCICLCMMSLHYAETRIMQSVSA